MCVVMIINAYVYIRIKDKCRDRPALPFVLRVLGGTVDAALRSGRNQF
jgi:hypothetical protein